ncbi:Hypothetical predicted protein [Mytilus galloprovincialis]|uniref:Mab-21-like HhH/H2TH-like domain-containing protein n=1 Tax=Mytilus galloprovincialis TaxID=29158 RepID=A0A8B6C5S7_MYTGA|nr:Hypothetical predicted protein [Mytilus galloprovincialis]
MLEVLEFSAEQIRFNKYSYNFPYYVHRLLLPDIDHPIYVGSIAEGLLPGTFYRGEQPDTDAILTFFEEFNVVQSGIKLSTLEIKAIKEHPGYRLLAINDTDFPGYVLLYAPHKQPFNMKNVHIELNDDFFPNNAFRKLAVRRSKADDEDLDHDVSNEYDLNGPSVTEKYFNQFYKNKSGMKGPSLIRDNVPCLAYLHWPTLADEWKLRFKSNGWLNEEIVRKVVSKQCLLAPVGHRDCDENEMQWRISFRGEGLIFEQLNIIQLYCFIVLKIILKDDLKEWLPDSNKTILSSYCIKHLIFWCIETTENISWSQENFVACVHLCLSRLQTYLKDRNLPHYIIPARNLFTSKMTPGLTITLQDAIQKYIQDITNVINLRTFDFVRGLYQQNIQLEMYREASIIVCYCTQKLDKLFFHYSQTNLFWVKYNRVVTEEIIETYEHVLNGISAANDKAVFRDLFSLLTKSILCVLSYSYYRKNHDDKYLKNVAIYLNTTLCSNISSLQLRSATILFMEERFDECITVCGNLLKKRLNVIPMKKTFYYIVQKVRDVTKLCMAINQLEQLNHIRRKMLADAYSLESKPSTYILSENSKGADIMKIVDSSRHHFYVRYMTAEMWAVPDVIQFELLSVPTKLKKHLSDGCPCPKYDQVPGIQMHPLLICYLLLFLSFDRREDFSMRNSILRKLNFLKRDDVLVDNDNGVFLYNILAYCNGKSDHKEKAAKYVVQSLKIFPSRQNAAFGYLKNIIQQSLKFISNI